MIGILRLLLLEIILLVFKMSSFLKSILFYLQDTIATGTSKPGEEISFLWKLKFYIYSTKSCTALRDLFNVMICFVVQIRNLPIYFLLFLKVWKAYRMWHGQEDTGFVEMCRVSHTSVQNQSC